MNHSATDMESKVLRRAHVSKMTRALQDRLALANVKRQNGWENLSLDAIEPKIEERLQLQRKRPVSSNDTISDTASTTSSRLHSSQGLASSPLTEHIFSDNLPRSLGSLRHKNARATTVQRVSSSGAVTNRRTRVSNRQASWKKDYDLAQSSPIKHTRLQSSAVSHLSLISEGSAHADGPPSPELSEDDDGDLPLTSFSINASTRITSSPPQTPPPDRRMRKRSQNVSWSRTPRTGGEEGADLLMYLATSPSPANAAPRLEDPRMVLQPPSTPPCKPTPLPSSHMTPGMSGYPFLGFGPTTPGTNFNFADFVNVTPSPAQGSWNRTPVAGRTPGASARRKLNFDTFVPPPSSSPVLTRSASRGEGLGMELGGELVS